MRIGWANVEGFDSDKVARKAHLSLLGGSIKSINIMLRSVNMGVVWEDISVQSLLPYQPQCPTYEITY